MPLYLFENIKTGEVREISFHMNDVKIYNGEENTEKGQWERRFTVPQAAIDTVIDPHSSRDFVNKTANKKGSIGSFMDASREMSEKREHSIGKDPVKEKYIANWKSKRKGKRPHPSEIQRNIQITH